MKKIIALLFLLSAICLSLAACGGPVDVAAETLGDPVYIKAQSPAEDPPETPPPTTPDAADPTEDPSPQTEPASEDPTEPAGEKILLGYVRENGRWYYYAEEGVRYTGWLQTEAGYSYFGEARKEGLCRIDGAFYYFQDGIMQTGRRRVRGTFMEFDEVTGRRLGDPDPTVPGDPTEPSETDRPLHGAVDGKLYEHGVIVTGLREIDGAWYYADEAGNVLTGKYLLNGSWYLFCSDGRRGEGFFEEGGNWYFAEDTGALKGGFVPAGGALRYFDPGSFAMVRNTSIGIYRIDESGICHRDAAEVTDATLDAYADSILAAYGRSPRNIYDYVSQNYAYTVMGWDSVRNLAIHMFNTGYGSCLNFCAITELLLNRAGYATQWVRGELGHYWLLVEMSPGVWRHMDTMRKNYHVYNLTDAELLAKHDNPYGVNFHWDTTQWTSTTTTGRGDGPPAGTPATEAPTEATTEAPTEEPATEEPTTEEPTTEEPTTEESTTEAPATEEPLTEEPATEAPTTEEPTTEEPATEAPTEATTEPPTEAPATEAPETEAPTEAPEATEAQGAESTEEDGPGSAETEAPQG